MLRWLTLACRLAGYTADEIDLAEAQDIAAEMVAAGRLEVAGRDFVAHSTGRLRPYAEWAGGDVLMAVQVARQREADHAMAEALF